MEGLKILSLLCLLLQLRTPPATSTLNLSVGMESVSTTNSPVTELPTARTNQTRRCSTVVSTTSTIDGWRIKALNRFGILLDQNDLTVCVLMVCQPLCWTHVLLCSDNRSCRSGFRPCYNQRCVANSRFCDGFDDCGDNSDEAFCGSESPSFDLLLDPLSHWRQNPVTLRRVLC